MPRFIYSSHREYVPHEKGRGIFPSLSTCSPVLSSYYYFWDPTSSRRVESSLGSLKCNQPGRESTWGRWSGINEKAWVKGVPKEQAFTLV